jgi:hypothetical protein
VAAALTKRDLTEFERRVTSRFGAMPTTAVGMLLGGLAATASIVLDRLLHRLAPRRGS